MITERSGWRKVPEYFFNLKTDFFPFNSNIIVFIIIYIYTYEILGFSFF